MVGAGAPGGALRGMMDEFEAANPGIKVKLLSGPYASTKEQLGRRRGRRAPWPTSSASTAPG